MFHKTNKSVLAVSFLLALHAVLPSSTTEATVSEASKQSAIGEQSEIHSCDNATQNGTALFGDLHIHTRYSFDAAANSTGATPEDAHRYARGEEIPIFPINDQGLLLAVPK